MRLILHVGPPKTGTSTIQHALAGAREALAAEGYLYPSAPFMPATSNFLAASLLPADRRPRFFRNHMPADVSALFQDWVDHVGALCASGRFHTLVLSGENFWRLPRCDALGAFRDILATWAVDEVAVHACVRQPSALYASSLQQRLRGSHRLPAVKAVRYRPVLAAYRRALGAKIRLTSFDALASASDFVAAFWAELASASQITLTTGTHRNQSLSAECLAVLHEVRLRCFADQPGAFVPDMLRFGQDLARIDEIWPGTKLRLRPEISAWLDRPHGDLEWLRTKGLIGGAGGEPVGVTPPDRHPLHVGQIAVLDSVRLARVRTYVIEEGLGPAGAYASTPPR